MTALLFTTAATRLLRDKYGWEQEAFIQFGDELVVEALALAGQVNATTSAAVAPAAGRPPAKE